MNSTSGDRTSDGLEGIGALPMPRIGGVAGAVERERVFGALFGESSRSVELGRYVIISALGRGGMGSVFKAFDPTLDRLVALKVLHRELDHGHTARLRREAKALAKLSHPNVVQVYEIGEVAGQTFVAMEMVEGRTLREWMKQSPRIEWRACVRLFIQLGAGLVAAHEQGLVHRDFKPSNAIIDDKGRPRVLDFGLARRAEALEGELASMHEARTQPQEAGAPEESLTKTGAVLGTPAYMPLEQMSGGLADARSDQFSFCVALYEALYGERPYAGDTVMALMMSMQGGRVRPAPKGSAVPVSLRAVLLRGLATSPDARWPSMEALLEQLRGLVAARRGRGTTLALTVGILAIGGGLGALRYAEWKDRCANSAEQLRGVWDEDRSKEVEAAIVGTEVSYAPDTWGRVETRLDEYAGAWTDKHTEACAATRLSGEQTEDAMGLRMRCLRERRSSLNAAVVVLSQADAEIVENAVTLVAQLPALERCDDLMALERQQQRVPPPEDPRVAEQVERLREQLAEVGAEEDAGLYAAGLEHVERVIADASTLDYEPLLVEAMLRRGRLQMKNGRYAEAERELTDAYGLAVEHDHAPAQLSSANALVYLVGFHLGRHAEGRQWSTTTLPLARRLGEPTGMAVSWSQLGLVLGHQGEYEEAKAAYERSLTISREALGPAHPTVAQTMGNLGSVLQRLGEYEEATTVQRRVLEVLQEALGPAHPTVATSWGVLGNVLQSRGEYDEARAAYERSLEILQEALGPDHPRVAGGWMGLGIVLKDQGEYEQARAAYERALEILGQTLGAEHPSVGQVWGNLGGVLKSQGKYEEARAAHERALRIFEATLGAEHPNVGLGWNNVGSVLASLGEYEEAKAAHERALRILREALGSEHRHVAMGWSNMGSVLASLGEYEEAKAAHERARQIREATLGVEHAEVAESWNNLGEALRMQGEHEAAIVAYERGLSTFERALGPEHPLVAHPLVGLALIELEQGRFDAARAHAERAVSIRSRDGGAARELADARFVLARALWSERSDRAQARTLAEQAREVFAESGRSRAEALARAERWLATHRAQ